MAKTVKTGIITDKINGISVNAALKCHTSNCNNSEGREVAYVVMHYTGNTKDTAKNNANYFTGANRDASAHLFVDDSTIYQSVELRDIAWHCGTTGTYYHSKCRNTNSFGIEMCCTAGNYKISETTKKNAAYLCAYLCKIIGIGSDQVDTYVLRHYDITHKTCPAQMVSNANEWVEFKTMVKNVLNTGNVVVTKPAAKICENDLVKLSADATYYNGKAIPSWVKNTNWYVSSVTGDRAVIDRSENGKSAICSPVNTKYLSVVKAASTSNTNTSKPVSTAAIAPKAGDLVRLASNATYYNGKSIPSWVKNSNWYVSEVKGDRVVIDKSENGKRSICSAINAKYLTIVKAGLKATSSSEQKMTAGRKITLNKCPIYSSSTALFKSGTISGTYYLWESNATKNRIRITNSSSNVGKSGQITGWIKTSNIK
jgi:N-acetylmuramoyl-L-alanine amidase CwlA